jgi:Transglycosylase SLT domain
MLRLFLLAVTAVILSGCATLRPDPAPETRPVMRWDFRPEAATWTRASLDMLQTDAAVLTRIVPEDAEYWCPGYTQADTARRAAFWTGFMSALARYESTWNPDAVGGGGLYFGLLQILPATARYRNCEAGTGAALRDGAANLRCALRIMAITVPRDGVISQGRRGAGADWGPMRDPAKTAEMRAWLGQQSYCRA